MKRNKKLKRSIRKFSQRKEDVTKYISGELGIRMGGSEVVDVPNRAGYVFVRVKGNTSELIQAFNNKVPSMYDYPVLLEWKVNTYVIVGKDQGKWSNIGNGGEGGGGLVTPLPRHGGQHSFAPELGMGADPSWIYSRQFMNMLAYPSGSSSMMLTLSPHFYENDGQWSYPQTTGIPSFAPHVPTVTGSAKMALLYLNKNTNALEIVSGPGFSGGIVDPAKLAPFIPDVDRSYGMPLAAVKLTTGTTAITWSDVYDMRDFYTVSSSAGGAWGGVAIQDDGTPVGTGTVLNFGSNLTATILGGVVTIDGAAGGAISTGTLDARYLRLDTSNDPLQDGLAINATGTSKSGIQVTLRNAPLAEALEMRQFATTGTVIAAPFIYGLRQASDFSPVVFNNPMLKFEQSASSGTISGGFLQFAHNSNLIIQMHPSLGGANVAYSFDTIMSHTPTGVLFELKNNGTNSMHVDGSGTVHSNGVPLIKEAPANSLPYVRRNRGWEVASTGTASAGDVFGPTGSVAGNLAAFSDTTGKLLQDSGFNPSTGWLSVSHTWTRTGNHSFTVSGDVTSTYRKYAKVRYKDGGSFEYGVIASSSHSAGTTTVTLIANTNYAMAATTITDTYLSYSDGPEGFPAQFDYTTVITATGGGTTSVTYTVAQAKWTMLGTNIKIDVNYTITSIGTGTGTSRFSVPVTSSALFMGYGRENALTGSMLQAIWDSGGANVRLLAYNNGSVLTNNYNVLATVIGAF